MSTAWRHPKFLSLSTDARALWFMAMSWSVDTRTDGHIAANALHQIIRLPREKLRVAAHALAAAKLWEHDGDNYLIHDWFEYNESVADMDRVRNRRREGAEKTNEKRWGYRSSDSSSYRSSDRSDLAEVEGEGEKNPPGAGGRFAPKRAGPKQAFVPCPSARHAGQPHMQPMDTTVDPPICRACEKATRPPARTFIRADTPEEAEARMKLEIEKRATGWRP